MNVRPLLLAAWLAALAVFAVISVLAATNDTFPNDVWLARQIQEIDSPAVDRALDWAEDAAAYPLILLVAAAAAALLVLARDNAGAIIIALAIPIRAVTTAGLKELIERPRPSADLIDFESQPSSFSFPSGHAGAAFVLYGLIIYFAAIHIRDLRVRLPIQALVRRHYRSGGHRARVRRSSLAQRRSRWLLCRRLASGGLHRRTSAHDAARE